ncbi:rhodanese-like domain-containing protein [Nocardioides sp. BP30]|uniref:rhodanese-like domain-containing protein n=1 Tax=Nocardioides sp. BP30 TaxID=3036374 RepID=UPI002468D6D8|nr:rhodanese-like domain-containing protein [Nocardioides sp. BP30]WGL52664.1 rhodanese-like domain-containing protein [Nocardioides sp. BP30]
MSIPTVEVTGVPDPIPVPVLDVREDFEWQAGHIDGALHIPLSELPARVGEVPDGQFLVTCKVGGRSAQAVAWLTANGHEAVNLAGGMLDWAAAGRPMVSENGQTPTVA